MTDTTTTKTTTTRPVARHVGLTPTRGWHQAPQDFWEPSRRGPMDEPVGDYE